MAALGRTLVVCGVGVALVGLLLMLAPLPGDIVVTRERFTFFFPVVTCLVVSVVLTLLVNLFLRP
jgi:hypothetical protein